MNNNWIKTLNKTIPYLEYPSLAKKSRSVWISQRHNHITHELHIILQGSCKVEIASEIINLQAGQALLICPNAFHCSIETSVPFLRFSISFLMAHESAIRCSAGKESPYILFHATPEILRMCYETFEEYDTINSICKHEMLSALLSQLLIHAFRIIQQKTSTSNVDTADYFMFQIIDDFFAIPIKPIEKNYSRKALAESLHCSERQLNRLIYKLYGITFEQKRLQARMDYAKFLLHKTDNTIAEICTLVGYTSESTFYRFFKSNCGMTPQEFRRSHSK